MAISLTGIMAVVTIPKVISAPILVNEITDQQLLTVVEEVEKAISYNVPVDLVSITYHTIFLQNGNYFLLKGAGSYSYFLQLDGARITAFPELFAPASPLTEYATSGLTDTQWKDPIATESTYCGEFHQTQCLYVDLNGKKAPNQIGGNGDIIAIRIDPATGEAKTLYEWAIDPVLHPTPLTTAQQCAFVSIYDVMSGVSGASSCGTGGG